MPLFPRQTRSLILALSLTALGGSALGADLAGPYLATRLADHESDFTAMVTYGPRTLTEDPENLDVMEGLVISYIALGQMQPANAVARQLLDKLPDSQIAGMAVLSEAAGREDWDSVVALLDEGVTMGGLMDGTLRAWAVFAQGQVARSLDLFDDQIAESGLASVMQYQKAMVLAQVGDFEGAEAILGDPDVAPMLSGAGNIARLQILSQLERYDEALALYDRIFGSTRAERFVAMRDRLAEHKPLDFDAVTSPRQAVAQVIFEIGQSIASDTNRVIPLLYGRVAEALMPDETGPILFNADLLDGLGHFEQAIETFARVPEGDPSYPDAQMGIAQAQRQTVGDDAAIDTLEALVKDYPDLAGALISLGDLLRYNDRYDEARKIYDRAIALFTTDLPQQWIVYFARAITYERLDRWDEAEADFRKALELSPGQPAVLNYMGYSFVEQRRNYDEALDMIREAVANRPDDGYIVDSLGWAYYRLGRYDEAVTEMERAVGLIPGEPILNDHLGDTYWAVGRTREARFQWRRALSFVSDDTDLDELNPDRIRRKLEVGLDAVLEEEGADPIVYLPDATD